MSFEFARRLVDEGKGDELVEMTSPTRLWIPARNIVDKYGIEDRYDIVEHAGRVRAATLVFLDTKSLDESAAHRALDAALSDVARSHASLSVQRVPDNISYAGSEVAVANQIAGWRSRRDAVLDAGI